jgi:hypothetical protein
MELPQGLLALDLPRKRVSCTRDYIRLTGYMILSINQSHLSTSERNLSLEARRSGIESQLGPMKVESKVACDDDKHKVSLSLHSSLFIRSQRRKWFLVTSFKIDSKKEPF